MPRKTCPTCKTNLFDVYCAELTKTCPLYGTDVTSRKAS